MRSTLATIDHTGTMPQILLAGAPTGCWTNLGDEAILTAMAADLRAAVPDVELTVVSSSPDGFFDAHGCAAVRFEDLEGIVAAVAGADLVVLGGGSIFFDYWGCDPSEVLTPRHQGLSLWTGLALLAAAHEVPAMTWGVGLGPLRTPEGELLAAAALELCTRTVRDPASVEVAARLPGDVADVLVTGDPVVGLDLPDLGPADPDVGGGAGPVLGVALRQWDVDVDADRWPVEVAAALDAHLERTGGTARFVPCHRAVRWPLTDDAAAAEAVRSHMAHPERTTVVDVDRPWAERAALLAACDEVLAMRYHAALVAMVAGVPTVGVPYDPKVTGLLEDWGVADLGLDITEVAAGPLAERLSRLTDERTRLVEHLGVRAGELAEREAATTALAVDLVGSPAAATAGGPAVGALLARLAEPTPDRPASASAALDRLRDRRGEPRAGRRPTVAILTNRLLDRDTAEPRIGGAERYALDLARLLDDLGLEPRLHQVGGSWGTADFFGYPVVALPEGDEAYSEFNLAAGRAFHEASADDDHVLYLMPNLAAGPMRDDAVVVVHGVWWDHDRWEHLSFRTPEWYEHLEAVVGRARRVLSVDANAINVVRALFPAAAERMRLVPNGVDVGEFHPPDVPRDGRVPLVLFPRRADVIRGPLLVGPLLEQVPDPARFLWVGEGDPAMVDELARVAAADPRLSHRTATFDEMADLYRQADVVVIPTVASEGQSLACLEAMASGCAVVVTGVGGLPELVDDDVDGLVCEPNPESLAAAVRRLVRDPALRRRLGTAARARARRHAQVVWRADVADQLAELGWVGSTTAAVPYDVVCFGIVDWEFRWQRPQQLAAAWGRRGRRVFYVRISDHLPLDGRPVAVEPVAEGVWEVRLALPEGFDVHLGQVPEGFEAAGLAALRALVADHGIGPAVGLVEMATWTPLAEAARAELGWPVVYDCMDDWATFPGFDERPGFLALEDRLVATADAMVVSSATIAERWSSARSDLVLARNAADFAFFHDLELAADGHDDPLPDVTGPVAGFFGAVVEWFDVEAVRHTAAGRPDVTFVLVGNVARVDVSALEALPNVVFTGTQPYEAMPRYLRRFDVALIPFVVGEATDGMDVVKVYEYLSQGVPIVSTPIREIVPYGDVVHLADTPAAFAAAVDAALAEDDPAARRRRIALARANSWDDRIDLIERRLLPLVAGGPDAAAGPATDGSVERVGTAAARARIEELGTAGHALRLEAEDLRRQLDALHRSRAVRAAGWWWRARAAVERRLGRR